MKLKEGKCKGEREECDFSEKKGKKDWKKKKSGFQETVSRVPGFLDGKGAM